MGLFSILAGSSKSVDKIVDAGINGVDAMFYTDEEKAQHKAKMQELYFKFVEISANESTTQSVSRRMICMPVVYVWLALIIANVCASLFAPALDTATISDTIKQMNTPALAAIGFYVGRHLATSFNSK